MTTTSNENSEDHAERQPLLKQRTPLPLVQLLTVFAIQFAEPVTATVVMPFIPQFIKDTGITGGDERKVGYYAGIIQSIFFISESLTVYPWARLSDRIGRRPTLLLGPLGLAFAMYGFGLSKTFASIVLFRLLQGAFNGNIGVSKTVLAEISDPTNIGDAFSYTALMWVCGITTGPFLGGLLVNPAETWPNSFGKVPLLREYPYFLPCATAGTIAILIFLFGFFTLEESSPSHKKLRTREPSTNAEYSSIAQTSGDSDRALTALELVQNPRISIVLISYALMAFSDMAFASLLLLVYSTSIETGGIGLSTTQIGKILGTFAILRGVMQAFVYRRLIRRFGVRNMFVLAVCGIFTAIALLPVLVFVTKWKSTLEGNWIAQGILVVQLLFGTTISLAYATVSILTVDSAPNQASLSATNGLAQTVGCVTRGLGPSVGSTLFAISLEGDKRLTLGGNLVYVVVLSITSLAIRYSLRIPKKMRMVE